MIKIKVNALSDNKMKDLGFTDFVKDKWYYSKSLRRDITFNLTIDKHGGSFVIDVLDEDFMQPYDYQYILNRNPNHIFALAIKDKVEEQMLDLVSSGVIEDYERGEYI